MKSAASTVAETIYVEDGKRVYPCRCGETHRGDYAFEDWAHHNCFHHEQPLLAIDWLVPILMCGECGQVFDVREVAA